MSIGPSNRGRSISNFDITFYSTLETTGWSPDRNFNGWIFVDQKLFFEDFEIGFSIGKFKVRVCLFFLTVRSFLILDMFEIIYRYRL